MGWTGGQYSLYRVLLAMLAGGTLATAADALLRSAADTGAAGGAASLRAGLLVLAFVLAGSSVALIAIGHRDRLAAGLLAPFLLFAELLARSATTPEETAASAWRDALAGRTALLPALLLALHARVPGAPFGSLDARGRIDPRGDWARPAVQTRIGWALLAGVFAARLLLAPAPLASSLAPPLALAARAATALALAFALLGLVLPARRPALWGALALLVLGRFAAEGAPLADAGLFGLLLLACEPCDWPGRTLARDATVGTSVPDASGGRDERGVARLFYDGDCGFCQRSVRLILAEEHATPPGLRLRFAPLAGPTFEACLARHPGQGSTALPDSIVLEREDGRLLVRSAAVLEIASRLGGLWRLLALGAGLLPEPLLDVAYDGVARIRTRLFTKPKDTCPILPPDLRERFDP